MTDTTVVNADEVHGCPTTVGYGQTVVHAPVDRYLDVINALKDDGYDFCIDLTAVDYLRPETARRLPAGVTAQRFEVVVSLLSMSLRKRIRIRTQVADENAVVPTLFDVFPGTEAMEREVFDLMGIRFSDHPDLTRILMPEDWEGHPLRKDYDPQRIPVQFKYTQNHYDTTRANQVSEG